MDDYKARIALASLGCTMAITASWPLDDPRNDWIREAMIIISQVGLVISEKPPE